MSKYGLPGQFDADRPYNVVSERNDGTVEIIQVAEQDDSDQGLRKFLTRAFNHWDVTDACIVPPLQEWLENPIEKLHISMMGTILTDIDSWIRFFHDVATTFTITHFSMTSDLNRLDKVVRLDLSDEDFENLLRNTGNIECLEFYSLSDAFQTAIFNSRFYACRDLNYGQDTSFILISMNFDKQQNDYQKLFNVFRKHIDYSRADFIQLANTEVASMLISGLTSVDQFKTAELLQRINK